MREILRGKHYCSNEEVNILQGTGYISSHLIVLKLRLPPYSPRSQPLQLFPLQKSNPTKKVDTLRHQENPIKVVPGMLPSTETMLDKGCGFR